MLQKYDTKYDYTPGGNISRKKQSAWGVGTEGNSITDVNLSYDNEYKYDSPKPHAVTKVGSTEYTYDLDGRMTGSYDSSSKFKRTFTWDEEGRLLKTVDNKHTTDYRYDANGERICKYSDLGETIYASGYYTETDGKKISKHIYIGSTRVASQVMSRSCETSTTMKRENTLYYHTDHLGSSGYVTDKKGEFYEHTEYTSSGESWVNEKVTGNANLPFKYTSKEMDSETGLYYHSARYRDARTGVWLSCDPILEMYLEGKPNGGIYNSINLNLYHYAGNNPVAYTDPTGMLDRKSESIAVEKEGVTITYQVNGGKVEDGDTFWSIAKEEIEAAGGEATNSKINKTAKAIMKANGYENDKLKPGDKLITGIYETGIYEKGIESVYPELFLFGGAKAGQLAYKGMQKFLMSDTGIKLLLLGGAGSIGIQNGLRYGTARLSNMLLSNAPLFNSQANNVYEFLSPWLDTADMSMPTSRIGKISAGVRLFDVLLENFENSKDDK